MKRISVIKRQFRLFLGSLLLVALFLLALPGGLPSSIAHLFQSTAIAASNPIQIENSNPGTPGWNDFAASLTPDLLSGFGSKISVNHGDSIDFYVTTTAPSFTIDIFRTGYYGGVGARLITSLGSFPGLHQAIPNPDKVTGMISCSNWTKTTTLKIPSSWVTGIYLAKLTSSTGNSSFIFFVVRNDGGHEMIDFQTSVTTYQAYNTWGGTSLYNNLTNLSIYKGPHAVKVSFDRPFNPGDSDGAGHYFFYENKFVYWMESQGYDISYTTDVDTDQNVGPLTNHRAFLSVGHDEYWSNGMRTTVQNAINAGVNVGFFGGNAMYWQIRFEPNAAGVADRVEVGYKDYATDTTFPGPDPMWGVNNAIVTTNWRADPVNKPENAIMGVMFEDQTYQDQGYPFVIQNASSWVYAGTGFVNGSSVPGIVGYEYDKVFNNGLTPAGLTILGNSPLVGYNNENSVSNATLYTAASGARVFASGTIQWSWGLANINGNTLANAGIQKTTANILNNFIQGTGPTVALNPTSVDFGNQIVGAQSTAQTVTLSNSGSSTLTFSNITITGTNATDFAQTNTCMGGSNKLAAGSSCTISVTFKPGALGTRSASLTFTDNATDSPQSVALTGTGAIAAPVVSLNPTSVTFANQNVGTSSPAQAVTLTNSGTTALSISSIAFTGTNAADFTQTNTCPSGSNTLAAKSSCTINVTFTPATSGARSASLTFTDNATDSPQSVALSGTATVPTTYFSDGFESGNMSAWTLPSSDSTGTRTVESTVVNSGSYALSFNNASGQYAYVYTALPSAQAQTYTRFYFRFNSTVTGNTQLAIARNNNGGNSWELDYDANRHGLNYYVWSGTGSVYTLQSATNALSPNTWYSIELQDFQTTTGHAQAWLNGTSIGSVNADLSTSAPYAKVMLYDSDPGIFYFDDVIVSNVYNGTIAPSAGAYVNPTSLSFGNQNVGTTSASKTVTLTDNGPLALSISNIAITGTNATDFAQTNTCPSGSNTLASGSSCTVSVTFTPGALGTRSASLTFTDNATSSPQSVALSGTGFTPAPLVSLNPASLYFSNQNTGTTSAAQNVTLTNSGTTALTISSISLAGTNSGDFALTNTCPISPSTLAAGATCTISVTFSPTATGTRSASVSITDNASGSPQSVSLSGNGVAAGTYFSDGFESGNFSQWTVPAFTGQASVQSTVVNSGNDAAAFTNTSGQYTYLYADLANGAQTQTYTRFYFRFASLSASTAIAYGRDSSGNTLWEVDYDAGRQGIDVYFWNGARTRYDLYSNTNVLSANTWYSIEVQDTETSTGTGQVWLNGTSIGIVNNDLSVAAGGGYARLFLSNQAVGTAYFDDVVVSNSYNGPLNAAPAVSLSPSSLSFGNQSSGTTSAAQTVTLTNSGTGALSISSIGLTGTNAGDFAQTNTCPISPSKLAASASCTISVTFSPTAAGTRSASLTFTDNATSSPQSVALSGTGFTPSPTVSLSPSSLSFGNQNTGTTSTAQNVTLTNSGTTALTITNIGLTGTNAGDFAQTNTCPLSPNTLAAGATCSISVTFSPTATGTRSASVSITDNASGSPHSVSLSGSGVTAGVYFSDGFESGNFSQWTVPAFTGQASVQSTVVNSGNDAAAFTNASGQYTYLYADLANGAQTQTYTRFYFRFSSLSASTPIAYGRDSSGNTLWEVDYDAGRQGIDVYFWNGARTRYDLYSNTNVLSANTWYSIEVQDTETTTGTGQVWLNGTSIGIVNNDLSVAAGGGYARLFLYDGAAGTAYFDDVVVSNSYNGP